MKRYRFFDIGTDHYYYDDYENERSITETAERSYEPALKALLEMADMYGDYFKCAFSLSGCAIEMLETYAPQVIELLQELNNKGCVEFLAEPYSHGFSSIKDPECFKEEVDRVCKKVKALFGQTPKVFRNSALIYSDDIGELVAEMGFKGMLAEGAKQVLGWKSPHFVYNCNRNPNLKLLLRDFDVHMGKALRTRKRMMQKLQDILFRQCPEYENLAAGQKRGVDLKGRILCGRADQDYTATFHVRQESILLGFIEAVDFVNE